jgi:hypothetical protein
MADLDQAQVKALSILGKGAKLPQGHDAVKSANTDVKKNWAAYKKSIEALQKNIVEVEKSLMSYKVVLKQWTDRTAVTNFDLTNKDDKAVAAQIKQARDLLTSAMKDMLKEADDEVKALDELDKHTMALMSFKSSVA